MSEVKKDQSGRPLCPYCKKPTKRSSGAGTVTAMYFQPIYDENGINTNPDRNWRTETWSCLECGRDYGYSTNGDEEVIQFDKEIATNEELNIKVWELLGWKNIGNIGGMECWQRSESGTFDGMPSVSWGNISSSTTKDIPDFCNDEVEAFGLVKRIAEKGKSILVRFDAHRDQRVDKATTNEWTVHVEPDYRRDMPLSDIGREIVKAFICVMEEEEA